MESSKHGGKREGSGRKKGFPALQHEMAREILAVKLHREFGRIVDKAIEQAKSGDSEARRWLSDRAWGRPKDTMDLNVAAHISLKDLAARAHEWELENKSDEITRPIFLPAKSDSIEKLK
jgi:hypothetical protein